MTTHPASPGDARKALMESPSASPAEAVARVLEAAGISLPDSVVENAADAALSWADSVVQVQVTVDRTHWDLQGRAEHTHRLMVSDLMTEITVRGLLPTALPVETAEFYDWQADRTVPVSVHGPWSHALVTLHVTVRPAVPELPVPDEGENR